MNNLKVLLMMAVLTALFLAVGDALGGQSGMVWAFLLAAGMNLLTFYASGSLVLRAYGARTVTPEEAPELHAIVDRLRRRAELPMPTLAIAPQRQPNAFATGRDAAHAVVCVTEGALPFLSTEELEGVLAHELAHVRNRDMLLQTVAATLAGAIGYLAHLGLFFGGHGRDRRDSYGGILVALLAPLAAVLIQLAISRQREYHADAEGARISGKPLALASALRRLDATAREVPMRIPPAVAPLAQVNPLAALDAPVLRLFSTHPPVEERVARLEALAGRPGGATLNRQVGGAH
jgi:heat shock protein HtpX